MGLERAEKWERQFADAMGELDDFFEDRYHGRFRLHPARPERGRTASKSQSGLFSIVGKFSAGIGSTHGPGYIVDVRIATLDPVPTPFRRTVEDEVAAKIRDLLARDFPDLDLHIERDGGPYKVFGDLSLGSL